MKSLIQVSAGPGAQQVSVPGKRVGSTNVLIILFDQNSRIWILVSGCTNSCM